jgi:hypothetical protein
MDRNQLINDLAAGPVVVTFTKKDGSERIMPCTINEQIISVKSPGSNTAYSQYGDTLTVFDLEINDWRSFRLSAVKTAVLV